jgi:predicted RecA/RadA family phage recombinase
MKNLKQPGDIVDVVESVMVHPTHTDGLVDSGDQIVVGTLVGVAETSAAATTDVIAVIRRGVVNVSVTGVNAGGNVAVAFGDKLYIDAAAAAAVNKKVANQPFGIALGAVTSGATASIDVLLTGF